MAWYRCGGGGLPAGLQSDMDTVLNKKFSTSTTYPPTDWPDTVNLMGPLPEKTASGAIAHITDGADGVPIKNWQVTLPASLSGYSAIGCTKSGKNLANGLYEYNARNMIISPVFLRGGTVYTVSFTRGVNVQYIYIRKGDTVSLVGDAYATGSNATSFTFTADEDAYYYAQLYRTNTSDTWADYPVSNPQIEVGSTATAYTAYTAPTTATASLGRTIYGGTADVVTGEGEDGSIRIDLSELTWNVDGGTRFRARLADYTTGGGWSGNWQNTLSNAFTCVNPATAFTDRADYTFANIPQNYYNFDVKAPVGAFADVNAFKQWLANIDGNNTHAVVVIDRLAATDFTFTPIPTPETPLGVSNFWADEGDSDVTYRADISLALQALGGGGRGLMMMRPTEPEETEETEETEGLEDELNR